MSRPYLTNLTLTVIGAHVRQPVWIELSLQIKARYVGQVLLTVLRLGSMDCRDSLLTRDLT